MFKLSEKTKIEIFVVFYILIGLILITPTVNSINKSEIENLFEEGRIITFREDYAPLSKEKVEELIQDIEFPQYTSCLYYAHDMLERFKKIKPNSAFGVYATKNHIFNFFIDEQNKVWYLDTQIKTIYEDWKDIPILKNKEKEFYLAYM